MVVHFPIAFWVAATGAWFVALLRKNDDAWRFGLWLHVLGLLGGAGAAGFGFWAAEKMGHDSPGHALIHVHRDITLWTMGLAFIVTCLGWWKRTAKMRVPIAAMSVVLVGLLAVGADRGAELVFRYGMGVADETPPKSAHTRSPDNDHDRLGPQHALPAASHADPEAHHPTDAGQGDVATPIGPTGSDRETTTARDQPAPPSAQP